MPAYDAVRTALYVRQSRSKRRDRMSECYFTTSASGRTTARHPEDVRDAPSDGERDVADPILTRRSALELRRQSRRQELDLEHHFLARSRRLAVLSKRGPQERLVDQEVEGNRRICRGHRSRCQYTIPRQCGCFVYDAASVLKRGTGEGMASGSEENKSSTPSEITSKTAERRIPMSCSCVVMCHHHSRCPTCARAAGQAIEVFADRDGQGRRHCAADSPFSRTLLMSSER